MSSLPADADELQKKSAAELFETYDSALRRLADEFAPPRTAVRRMRRLSPWFDDDCRTARRRSRLLERRYRRTKSDSDRASWIAQMHAMHDLYRQKETLYWTTCIASNAGTSNSKRLWKSVSSILKNDKDPFAMQPSLAADQLSKFFVL